jgi:putative Ig domain-containing protein/VCBS repeat protein/FG-GAP repeat protein
MHAATAMPSVFSGETVTVSVGTLPAGKSIVITYQATINATPITGSGFSLTHQGTISGTSFTAIVTDDPDTAAADDPTITAMTCPTITVAPASLPQATFGTAFGPVTFTASGGNGTTTFAQTETLPAGLTFDAPSATLSGTPTVPGSFTFTITATDQNGCSGSQSYTLAVASGRAVLTGADMGSLGPHVRRFNAIDGGVPSTGALDSFYAFAPTFPGGVRVSEGDVNGDGVPDLITGAGPGGTPTVSVFDGASGALVSSFFAYELTFNGGVYVAAGDVNRDGYADVITGSGAGRVGEVKVYSGPDGAVLHDTVVFGSSFTGGVRVAAGDVDGDGFADLVAGAGPGPDSTVTVLSGADLSVLRSFSPYGPFPAGVFVAAGDVTGDGFADVITGADAGGGPHVIVFDGVTGAIVQSFFAFDPAFPGGVRVAAGDVNGDGRADIIAGAGPGGTPEVRVFDAADGSLISTQMPYDSAFTGGVHVATNVPVNRMTIEAPAPSTTLSGPFTLGGWAFEENASDIGIDRIDVWAIPIAGGPAQFLGAATLGLDRTDVAAQFGQKYLDAGFTLDAPALPAGTYDVWVFARSSVSGVFNTVRIVRITVTP